VKLEQKGKFVESGLTYYLNVLKRVNYSYIKESKKFKVRKLIMEILGMIICAYHRCKDLKEGMILNGTVRNVIDFGAFVDIGVKHDGLVHISELSESYVKNPSDIVSIGDVVKVKVIKIDNERQKVSLSMKI
jgi:transcriptional accessory protein Tex/SPT6